MSNNHSIEKALEVSSDYLKRLGDEVEDNFEGSADGEPLEGLVCSHGAHTYLVMACRSWEWVQLRYPLNIDQLYAAQLWGEGNISQSLELSEAEIQQARQELDDRLNRMPAKSRREFRMNLMHMLSREGMILELDTTTTLNIHGFNIDTKVFIFDPGFSLGDFHDNLQKIINLGWVGNEFLAENYGFGDRENNGEIDGYGGNRGGEDL